MQKMTNEYLQELVEIYAPFATDGKAHTSIPEINEKVEGYLGVAISDMDGEEYKAGDTDFRFSMQSMSKAINYLVALEDLGFESVYKMVGVDASDNNYASITAFKENGKQKPFNPFLDEGALAVTSMIAGEDSQEKMERILKLLRKITGNNKIKVNDINYEDMKSKGSMHRAFGYLMEHKGIIPSGKVEDAIDLYFKGICVHLNTVELARIGSFLANDGYLENEGKQLVKPENVRILKAVMQMSGMYTDSGDFAVNVGIPSKSGISGGIISAATGKMGIGVFGPSINQHGTSVAGAAVLKQISEDFGLNMFKHSVAR